MNANQRHRKVPCGGWILEREADAHIERCEMCEAFLDYKQELFNNKATIASVLLVIMAIIAIWAIIMFY